MDSATSGDGTKLFNLKKWTFEDLAQRLPVSLPIRLGDKNIIDGRKESKKPLVLRWEDYLARVEILDDSWIADIKAVCDPVWHEQAARCGYILCLDKMVALTYHWIGRSGLGSKCILLQAWIDMKKSLLLWAEEYRRQKEMESYLRLYPIACLGEPLVIEDANASTRTTGHLCQWIPGDGVEWECIISVSGQMTSVFFTWTQLVEGSIKLSFSGEVGKIHQELIEAMPT